MERVVAAAAVGGFWVVVELVIVAVDEDEASRPEGGEPMMNGMTIGRTIHLTIIEPAALKFIVGSHP